MLSIIKEHLFLLAKYEKLEKKKIKTEFFQKNFEKKSKSNFLRINSFT